MTEFNECMYSKICRYCNPIYAGKPIIEIYMGGAKNSPNRSIIETNYKNRVEIHLLPGQSIEKGCYKSLDELRKKRIIKKK